MEKDVVERMGRALGSPLLSPTALSNLYTMGLTSQIDPRQQLPSHYTMPPQETRELRAKLILEEALETIEGLGFSVHVEDGSHLYHLAMDTLHLRSDESPNLEKIIDGCCDLHYVEVGTLCACGVPDIPHMAQVNCCNNAKFPKGKAIMHATIPGKFGKPEGWQPPNHQQVQDQLPQKPNFGLLATNLIRMTRELEEVPPSKPYGGGPPVDPPGREERGRKMMG
jgi:predicted HAD superfamily Cof-like phosphohydrolase